LSPFKPEHILLVSVADMAGCRHGCGSATVASFCPEGDASWPRL